MRCIQAFFKNQYNGYSLRLGLTNTGVCMFLVEQTHDSPSLGYETVGTLVTIVNSLRQAEKTMHVESYK